jgi:hypothetical protein
MSGGTDEDIEKLTNYYLGVKRSMVCIKDCIICLFALFCESIILIRACILCSFADGGKGNIEISTRDIRARDARVFVGDRL